MLGNFRINVRKEPNESSLKYSKLYCSLCSSLRKNNNSLFSVLVNNEIVLVLLSLEEFINGEPLKSACPSKLLLKKKDIYSHASIDKASEISVLLGWIYATDFLADENKTVSSKFVTSQVERILRKKSNRIYSKLDEETQKIIDEYSELTRLDSTNFDLIQSKSYDLAKQIFVEIANQTALPENEMEQYAHIFGLIGKSIAYLDPLLDIVEDKKSNLVFNPIMANANSNNHSIAYEYNLFLDKYWSIESEIKNQLNSYNKFSENFIYILEQGLENNAFRIKSIVENFKEEKIVNEALLSRVFSPNFCYETVNGYALSRYLAIGSIFPLFGCELPGPEGCFEGGCNGCGECGQGCG
ncbi:MAG: hypothetical protein EZS26_001657 [Candidatus Ordinivivax streblomastigis]|uniref:Uncharacterized protein n=1 Tax=Candidatus Ordinivivax streblomastigis TaxID=2540710 RepID=A0A5M8P115_9BACT|nr:MAG: hypothetical protein EZS26_001657 [Candidatus Ordinivivax streblomastigis]